MPNNPSKPASKPQASAKGLIEIKLPNGTTLDLSEGLSEAQCAAIVTRVTQSVSPDLASKRGEVWELMLVATAHLKSLGDAVNVVGMQFVLETLFEQAQRRGISPGELLMLALVDEALVADWVIAAENARKAKAAVEARHNQPGGYREKEARAVQMYRDGDYKNKDMAAPQIAAALGVASGTVRRWLRGL